VVQQAGQPGGRPFCGCAGVLKGQPARSWIELDQGPTYLCWLFCVEEAANAIGASFDKFECYRRVKGVPYVPPGQPATFDELAACIRDAAELMDRPLTWFGPDGAVDDFATFDRLLRDGSWFIIAGVQEQALQPGQDYGHYLLARQLDGPDVIVIDSYRLYDGGSDRYSLAQFHEAMRENFDAVRDALAFRFG